MLRNVLSHEGHQAEIELASNELHAEIYPKIAWSTPLTPDDTVVLPGLKFLIFMFLYRVRSLVYYQVPIFVPNTNKTLPSIFFFFAFYFQFKLHSYTEVICVCVCVVKQSAYSYHILYIIILTNYNKSATIPKRKYK